MAAHSVFLPEKACGQRRLAGYSPWGSKVLDTTEVTYRIPDHLTCLLRNLYAGQEATVRTGHGTTDWFQIGKGVHQAVYCHPVYLTYM